MGTQRKIRKAMGLRKVQIGEIIPSMVEEMEKGLKACIGKNQHRREPYYILFTADWYANGTQLRTVFRPSDKQPPMMLNTICWKIDNKSGRCEEMWVLPKDAPIQPIITDGANERIGLDGKKMPLIYG